MSWWGTSGRTLGYVLVVGQFRFCFLKSRPGDPRKRLPSKTTRQSTQQTYRNRILRVQLFIEEHLDEELALEQLARLAHFSPYHFHRVFRAMVGETVGEHVRRLRLERAALRLSSTDRPVDMWLSMPAMAHTRRSRGPSDGTLASRRPSFATTSEGS